MSFRDAFDEVNHYVDEGREALVSLCARLVAAESVNPPGDTTRVAAVLEDFLAGYEIAVERVSKVAHKPNLIGTIDGATAGRHLVFNGHMDTIAPGDESLWSVPIHAQTRKDGRLYGHGLGNMKGAVAGLAMATAYLAERRARWPGRLSFIAVADETVFGPDGTGHLLDVRPDLLADAVICGEGPGDMGLAVAEKGLIWIELRATGGSGQGMLATRGSAPTAVLCAALTEIDAWNEITVAPPPEVACLAANAGAHGLRLTANIGIVEGGHFVSQTAREARAEIDFRLPPGLAMAAIEARLDALRAKAPRLEWRRIKGWEANWSGLDSPVVDAVARAAEQVRGQAPEPVVRLPASDASRWRARGTPGICYGPQPTLAAGVDDYVEIQDLVDCAKVYALAALRFLHGRSA